MLKALKSIFLGCQHLNLTWPQSPRQNGPLRKLGHKPDCTVTCLDCGVSLSYDWHAMKVGRKLYPPPHQHPDIDPTLGGGLDGNSA